MASMGKCYKFMDTEDAVPENLIEVRFPYQAFCSHLLK